MGSLVRIYKDDKQCNTKEIWQSWEFSFQPQSNIWYCSWNFSFKCRNLWWVATLEKTQSEPLSKGKRATILFWSDPGRQMLRSLKSLKMENILSEYALFGCRCKSVKEQWGKVDSFVQKWTEDNILLSNSFFALALNAANPCHSSLDRLIMSYPLLSDFGV